LLHGASHLGALASGYQLAFGVGALVCLGGALASGLLPRAQASGPAVEPAPEPRLGELGAS
jgi:hypothetical protein